MIDWSVRFYSTLRVPAGTIVTFRYGKGSGAHVPAAIACMNALQMRTM